MYEVIFGNDTGPGKFFDVMLIVAILLSILTIMLESVESLSSDYSAWFVGLEWFFTGIFTVEYALRIWSVEKPSRYIFSFFGLIDLLSVIPTYLSLFAPGGQVLVVIRILRVMRVFRVLKLGRYMGAASVLSTALRASRFKISVFLLAVLKHRRGGRLTHVLNRGCGIRLHEHPKGDVLGHRDADYRRVRRHRSGYPGRSDAGLHGHGLGLRDHRSTTGIVTAEITAARLPERTENARLCISCGFSESVCVSHVLSALRVPVREGLKRRTGPSALDHM